MTSQEKVATLVAQHKERARAERQAVIQAAINKNVQIRSQAPKEALCQLCK